MKKFFIIFCFIFVNILYAFNDLELTNTNNNSLLNKYSKDGNEKQLLFLTFNNYLNENHIKNILKHNNSLITSSLRNNKRYKDIFLYNKEKKDKLIKKKNREKKALLQKRKKLISKINNLINNYYNTYDYYKKEILLELISIDINKNIDILKNKSNFKINKFIILTLDSNFSYIKKLFYKKSFYNDFESKLFLINNNKIPSLLKKQILKNEKNPFLINKLENLEN